MIYTKIQEKGFADEQQYTEDIKKEEPSAVKRVDSSKLFSLQNLRIQVLSCMTDFSELFYRLPHAPTASLVL